MAGWRLAPALETLRKQVNEANPNRSKVSDGTIGDAAHSARKSDHNPNSAGIVCAWDVTHDIVDDPKLEGDTFDAWTCADILLKNQDQRLAYVISNGRIGSGPGGPQPGVWRKYTGKNAHAHHTHVSVRQSAAAWNDTRPWSLDLPAGARPTPRPPEVIPAGITEAMRRRMARTIIDYEARRDKAGRLIVYTPAAGVYEVAGITSNNHPQDAATLRRLVQSGAHDQAERIAEDWILKFTKAATGWTTDAGLEFMLRDCIHHRGNAGAARILQLALGFVGYGPGQADGEIGHQTRDRLAGQTPAELIPKFRAAREFYERNPEPGRTWRRDPSDPKWVGLVNRWDKAQRAALKFHEEGRLPAGGAAAKTLVTGGLATGTVVAAGTAGRKPEEQGGGFDWWLLLPILVVGASLAAVAWFVWPKSEGSATQ